MPTIYRYVRQRPGNYLVYRDKVLVGLIERTTDNGGWDDTWFWTPVDTAVSGLMTAKSLVKVKSLGEAWMDRVWTQSPIY